MIPERLVHGLGTAPAPADWPALTLSELEPVLRGYDAVPLGIGWHSPRPFSAAARVRTDRGDCFVKRHHLSVRGPEDLAVEHAFAAHVGALVPALWKRTDGTTSVVHEGFSYEVTSPGTGEDLYRDALSWTPYLSVDHARAAGRGLARFHEAAAGFDAPARSTECLVNGSEIVCSPNPLAAAQVFVAARPRLAAALPDGWESALAEVLEPWPGLSLPRAWGHGDWHGSNLLWADGEVSAVLDLGLSDRTTPVHDVATALERSVVDWLALAEGRPATVHLDQALALLDGYGPGVDHEAVAQMLPVVHVEFALSELAYFSCVTGDPVAADLAWNGYLLGHAAWWRGEAGQALLDALR